MGVKASEPLVANLLELKNAPLKVFTKSERQRTGIYILDQKAPVGVVLSVRCYKQLLDENEKLQDKLYNSEIERRLKNKHPKLIDETEVDGDALEHTSFDKEDGWK